MLGVLKIMHAGIKSAMRCKHKVQTAAEAITPLLSGKMCPTHQNMCMKTLDCNPGQVFTQPFTGWGVKTNTENVLWYLAATTNLFLCVNVDKVLVGGKIQTGALP